METTSSGRDAAQVKKLVPLWRNRDYSLLIGGQVVSLMGTQVSQLAFPLLVLALTGSTAQAGFTGAMRAVPYVLLSLPAGALVDRLDRKRLMIFCDIARGLCFVSIPLAYLFGGLSIVQLYIVSLIDGVLFVFFNLANTASLPRVVAMEQLSQASAQNITLNSISQLVGPALGGMLYGLGRVVPFLTDAISYGVSVCSLFFIKVKFQGERSAQRPALWHDIRAGLIWLWGEPLLRFIGFLGLSGHLFTAGIVLLVIVLAQHMHASTFQIGLVLAMSGVGSIIGAFIGSRLSRRWSFRRLITLPVWLWALLWPLLAIAPNVFALAAILGAIGLVMTIFDVTQFSYRLALIPDELQGRVNGVYRMILFAGDAIGLTLLGILFQVIGPIATILIYGVCIILVAIVATLNKQLRNARSFSEIQAE